jgi:hypothetical protein
VKLLEKQLHHSHLCSDFEVFEEYSCSIQDIFNAEVFLVFKIQLFMAINEPIVWEQRTS